MSPMLTTSANGEFGCAKSASECVGWAFGSISGDRGSALLPDMKDSLGPGPTTDGVTCVASGLSRMSREKYRSVRGGSCWIFLCKASTRVGKER